MKIAVVYNKKKPNATEILKRIDGWAKEKGHKLLISAPLDESVDFLLALGGDGTMLRAVREAGKLQVPIMGINLGGLGFLTAFPSSELETALKDLSQKRIRIEERMLIRVRWRKEEFFALNDATFNMSSDARVIELSTYVNGEFLTRFTGDGLIVSTPTGSTAYSLAAGGPILDPRLEAMILTPICPHALSARPMLVPPTYTVTVEVGSKNPPVILTIDGQERRQLETGEKVAFCRAERHARIVMPQDVSFFQILRRKMRWGGMRDA
ncbi:NAD kinase [subsurface metagenome]|nr:NAD(+) kinase [bacterium]